MYKRILVPLDGSSLAEQVLPYARTLAAGLGSTVELLRCIEPVAAEFSDPAHGVFLDKVVENFLAKAKEYLETVSQPFRQAGVSVSYATHEGDPATKILEEAEKEKDTLIALSTHGRSGITRWVIGSVTSKVLEMTTNPMLVIHPQADEPVQERVKLTSMIVPLDGSKMAEQILPQVMAVARALTLKVILVRVTPSPADYYRYMEYPVGRYQDFSKEVDLAAVQYLEETAQKIKDQGASQVERRLMHGQPAAAVVDMAKETPEAIVAMSTHGRSGVGRWVLGSVADRVVRHSGSPVLLVRAAEEQGQ
ncbi:MAG: universal stress protein [Chloroflexi bacterium]|nr:universal stress protein [Chloroflexota bacterium]